MLDRRAVTHSSASVIVEPGIRHSGARRRRGCSPTPGYVVLRDDGGQPRRVRRRARTAIMNGGHAHADALVDDAVARTDGRCSSIPGPSTYTMDARIRDRFRSTASHNTVTIDGRSQSVPGGPFHWQTRGDAHLHGSRSNNRFGWAEAWHDAYMPIRHRRTFVRTARGEWLIADEILGDGHVTASSALALRSRLDMAQ